MAPVTSTVLSSSGRITGPAPPRPWPRSAGPPGRCPGRWCPARWRRGAASSGECSRSVSCASRRAWSRCTVSTSVPSSAARRRARSSGVGGQEHLDRRVGRDHRADVAALGHPVAHRHQLALLAHQRLTHRGVGGHARGGLGHLGGADGVGHVPAVGHDPVAQLEVDGRGRLGRRAALAEQLQAHRAVHRARVEVGEAQRLRRGARHRALAGPGGPVDSYDHERVRVPARSPATAGPTTGSTRRSSRRRR